MKIVKLLKGTSLYASIILQESESVILATKSTGRKSAVLHMKSLLLAVGLFLSSALLNFITQ